MNELKRQALEEVLNEMDQRIIYSLNETSLQDREDLKQEIYALLLEALEKMELVPLETFLNRRTYEKNPTDVSSHKEKSGI